MLRSAKIAPVFEYALLERFWRDADELGFHGVWNYDHFYGLLDFKQTTFEGWTTLAAMATVTSRARIGCMVSGVTYRHPALLAKMAASIDHICGGRLEFGIGAAWHEGEHSGYGFDFPRPGVRIAMLDEACEIVRRAFTEERVDFEGRFWTLRQAIFEPKPVQAKVPIVIGGAGERKTLRVVARHADEWNAPRLTPEEFRRLSGVLDDHCAAVGRDPSQIRRSVQMFLTPANVEQTREQIASLPDYEKAGVDHIVLSFYSPPSRDLLASLAPGA